MAGIKRIREFFERNVGKVVTTHDVAEIAGIKDYPRRIRELRNKEGMQISSYHDRGDLKPNEYVLESLERLPVATSDVSAQLRTAVLERDGYTCQTCGAGPADPDPITPTRRVRLHVDHIVPHSQGGKSDLTNLRTLCSGCNQGRKNIQTPSESALNLLARIRRAPKSVKLEVYEALRRSIETPSRS